MTGPAFAWSDRRVREALGLPWTGSEDRPIGRVSTDSRTLEPRDLFVALRGERFDGHAFLGQAMDAGCAGIVVDETAELPPELAGVLVYRVPDTLVALGDLALFRRLRTEVPVVGITGSSGKTTVKDLTVAALSGFMNTHGTVGNLNNRIGVPLTILSMTGNVEALVLEMGTNQPGEIAELARVAAPTVGVVTTVSETHVEFLGDLGGVLMEKLDLIRAVPQDGVAIVGDEPVQLPRAAWEIRPDARVCGLTEVADQDLRPLDLRLRADGTYSFAWRGEEIDLKIPGRHGVYNALLALAVAQSLGVPAETAAAGVSGVDSGAMRGEVRPVGSLTVLLDCYNANPQSVRAALATLLERQASGRRVAVLGTMLELGAREADLHREVFDEVVATNLDRIVVTGGFAEAARRTSDPRVVAFDDVAALSAALPEELEEGDTVLLKASRGVRLERVMEGLEESFGGGGD